MKPFVRERAAGAKWLGSAGGVGQCCSSRGEAGRWVGARHQPDAPLSVTEMEVKYALYEGNTGRDIKRWTAGEQGGIMTLTSSKGRWRWQRRMLSLSIHGRDGSTHMESQSLPTAVTFDLEEGYGVPIRGTKVKQGGDGTHLAALAMIRVCF